MLRRFPMTVTSNVFSPSFRRFDTSIEYGCHMIFPASQPFTLTSVTLEHSAERVNALSRQSSAGKERITLFSNVAVGNIYVLSAYIKVSVGS